MSREQRRAPRHKVRFKLVYDDGNTFNAGRVADVSEGGLFLETALPLPVGTVVSLSPLEPEVAGDIFEIRARVVRAVPYSETSTKPAGMGLEFLDLDKSQREQVVSMIHRLEDKAATSTSGTLDIYLGIQLPPASNELVTQSSED